VNSGSLVSTFLSSFNKKKSGTARSLKSNDVQRSTQINPIPEQLEAIESQDENSTLKGAEREEEDDDLGRSDENIDLASVDVAGPSPHKHSTKPILS